MSRYHTVAGRVFDRQSGWPLCPQRFESALGDVEDGRIFYRVYGHGGPPGERRPLLHIVTTGPAYRRGRPRKADNTRDYGFGLHPKFRFSSYAMDARGTWWRVLWNYGAEGASARSLARPPYQLLAQGTNRHGQKGKIKAYGNSGQMLERAQAALLAAELAQSRAADPHGLI